MGGWILEVYRTLWGKKIKVSLSECWADGKSGELQMHMEEPCFDFLRTKQTLG